MLKNGLRNFGLPYLESRVTLTVIGLEKFGAQIWKHLPIAIQIINIAIWNTAAKMGINILNILGFAALNITREIKVICEVRTGKCIAFPYISGRAIMKEHIHLRYRPGREIVLLSVDR